MSFFSGNRAQNSNSCATERIVINARKIFDGGIKQLERNGDTVNLSNFLPVSPTYPLTFMGCRSTGSSSVLRNLIIERINEGERPARIRADIQIPLEVSYMDAAGTAGSATATYSLPQDIVLAIPEPSIIPYSFEVIVSALSASGTINGTDCTLNLCITEIFKVVIDADIIVSSGGYCQYPAIRDFADDNSCNFFDLPLYPTANRR